MNSDKKDEIREDLSKEAQSEIVKDKSVHQSDADYYHDDSQLDENASKSQKKSRSSKIKKETDKRTKSLKIFSIGTVFLALAALIFVNLIFDSAFGKQLSWDMTSTQRLSIGDLSKNLVANLDKDVEVIALFELNDTTRAANPDFVPVLEDYEKYANSHLKISYIDPAKNPALLREIDPNQLHNPQAGDFVVRCGDKVRVITRISCFNFDEEYLYQTGQYKVVSNNVEFNFSGAIAYVISDVSNKAYFTSNHNESSSAQIMTVLKNRNFLTAELDLSKGEIPEDCDLLIFNNPKLDISEAEENLLKKYIMEDGGNLIVVSNFGDGSANTFVDLKRMNNVMHIVNMDITNNLIVELDMSYMVSTSNLYFWSLLDLAEPFKDPKGMPVQGFYMRSIQEYNNPKEYITVSPIMSTSSSAVVFVEGDQNQASAPNIIHSGMMSVYNGSPKESKVVALGSTFMTEDSVIQALSVNDPNPQTFGRIASHVVGDNTTTLNIPSAMYPSSALSKPPTTGNATLMVVIFFAVLPLSLVLVAIIVYNRRKKL